MHIFKDAYDFRKRRLPFGCADTNVKYKTFNSIAYQIFDKNFNSNLAENFKRPPLCFRKRLQGYPPIVIFLAFDSQIRSVTDHNGVRWRCIFAFINEFFSLYNSIIHKRIGYMSRRFVPEDECHPSFFTRAIFFTCNYR